MRRRARRALKSGGSGAIMAVEKRLFKSEMATLGAHRTSGADYWRLFLLARGTSVAAIGTAVRRLRHLGRVGRTGELPQLVNDPTYLASFKTTAVFSISVAADRHQFVAAARGVRGSGEQGRVGLQDLADLALRRRSGNRRGVVAIHVRTRYRRRFLSRQVGIPEPLAQRQSRCDDSGGRCWVVETGFPITSVLLRRSAKHSQVVDRGCGH